MSTSMSGGEDCNGRVAAAASSPSDCNGRVAAAASPAKKAKTSEVVDDDDAQTTMPGRSESVREVVVSNSNAAGGGTNIGHEGDEEDEAFENAKESFTTLLSSLASSPASRLRFLAWLSREIVPAAPAVLKVDLPQKGSRNESDGDDGDDGDDGGGGGGGGGSSGGGGSGGGGGGGARRNISAVNDHQFVEARRQLTKISESIKGLVPFSATLPSESQQLRFPGRGEDGALTSSNCAHLDAFLYDAFDEQRLVDEGKIAASRCNDCGGTSVQDIRLISHSMSKSTLEFLFTSVLPPLAGLTLVDVGSRLGAVLFGAEVYSRADKIIGVEINDEFAQLQKKIIKQFRLEERISVISSDVTLVPEAVAAADVVVLNNVFDWFADAERQASIWQFLHRTVAPGTLLVTAPALEQSLRYLHSGIDASGWVRELPFANAALADALSAEDDDQRPDLRLYKVL